MAGLQRRQYQVFIDRPPQDVFDFHSRLRNYARISPAEQQEALLVGDSEIYLETGTNTQWRLRLGGRWQTVETQICEWNSPLGFTERQVVGPFAEFFHRRKFTTFQTGTLMTDTVEYAPLGALGALADRLWMGRFFDTLFAHRHREAKRLLELLTHIRGTGE